MLTHRRTPVQKGKRKRQSRHAKKRLVKPRRHPQKRHTCPKKKRSYQRGGFFGDFGKHIVTFMTKR
jgi:hypothetical protein